MLIRLAGIVLVLGLAFWLWALFDVLTTPAQPVRALPKAVWVGVVAVLTLPGAVCWFVLGRPRRAVRVRSVVGPDDDPDFLRGLTERMRRQRDEPF